MWTSECTSDPTQSSFLAHTQLGTVKYHRCTLSEAKEYERDGHRILEEATGRLWRPFLTTISTYGSTQDPDAFYNQVEEVKKAERALGEAGQSASHDDSLTAGMFLHIGNHKSDADAEQMQARTIRPLTRSLRLPLPSQRLCLLTASA